MAGFVPLPRQSTSWEPLLRRLPETRVHEARLTRPPAEAPPPLKAPEAPKVIEPPKPPPGPDIRTLTASIRAEFEAKEAIRNREHSTALAQLEQLKAEEQALLTRLSHLSSHLEQARQQLLGQFRQGAGQLILEAARKIAGDGLKNQPELLDKMVQDATDALGKKGLVLYIGAIDSARLMDALENSGIAVEVDFSIEGGLRAETTAGRLDATLETALAAVADVISQWQQTNDRL